MCASAYTPIDIGAYKGAHRNLHIRIQIHFHLRTYQKMADQTAEHFFSPFSLSLREQIVALCLWVSHQSLKFACTHTHTNGGVQTDTYRLSFGAYNSAAIIATAALIILFMYYQTQ